ncbi:hypothetical protein V8E36_008756 [Tilletia maclaganii]
MFEVQRHNQTIAAIQSAPAAAFLPQQLPSSSSNPSPDPPSSSSPPPSGSAAALTMQAVPHALAALDSSSSAAAYFDAQGQRSSANAADAASYELNPSIKTVAQLWDEWEVGFAGGPAVKTLEQEHGTAWCGGPATSKRRAFLRRLTIIKRIRERAATSSAQEIITQLQQNMGSHSLDWLRKQLEKEK